MKIDLAELQSVSAEDRRAILEEVSRDVNASHGRMCHTAHYVGSALVIAVVLTQMWIGRSAWVCMLSALPAYFGTMFVGILLWRHSMVAEARRLIRHRVRIQSSR